MTAATTPSATSEPAELVNAPDPPARRRRVPVPVPVAVVVVVVVLVAAGAYVERTNPDGISFAHPLGVQRHKSTGVQDNNATTTTATVVKRSSLSETMPVNGTLGYAGSYTVLGQSHGTFTWLPAAGQVIRQGRVLYRVDGHPVVLLNGSTPAYRTLGATAGDVTGADVAQLNHDLVALGYVGKSDVDAAWDEFGWVTKAGIEKLQEHLGVEQTGTLASGDYVFLPTAARVTAVSATLGGPAGGPIMMATSTTRQVSVDLDASQQSEVKAGDHVTITLPGNNTTPGVVSSVGTVATTPSASGSGDAGNSTPTVPVHIRPIRPSATGRLDQAPVQVAITTATVHDVLVVPVNALLALSGGGYAVEVANADGTHHLVTVSPGLFDDAAELVQVTGSGLAAGEHVVVPAS
jgi:hypothetical protein